MPEQAGNGWTGWKWLDMTYHGWEQLEQWKMAGNGCKWLEISKYGWKWKEIVGIARKG